MNSIYVPVTLMSSEEPLNITEIALFTSLLCWFPQRCSHLSEIVSEAPRWHC